MVEQSDRDLLAELGVDFQTKRVRARTPREERIIAGFEDIMRFHEEHGRVPQHGEDKDTFERLFAIRLDRLREQDDCRELLQGIDRFGLLDAPADGLVQDPDALDDEALLAELGVEIGSETDIRTLKNVSSQAERRASEEIASHTPCRDFETFEPMFDVVQSQLVNGERTTRPFGKDASISKGDFFILRGQLAYVAEIGETIKAPNGQFDARLRVIYSNGTESNLLRWSLQRALYKDDAARRVSEPAAGPLFGEEADNADHESGTIYVLRSKSDHPAIAPHREVLHKIGVTGGEVSSRVAGASQSPTFLFADVEIVATYKLFNINRAKLEHLIHRVFAGARLQARFTDRFGAPVEAKEWFFVPLNVIDEAVGRIRDQTITRYRYDPSTAKLSPSDE
ncbi:MULTISPECIES: GIY-YIG nuclease family protein [Sphingomonas]|uniref:GIY-YIG nuclease family protein n=1 Tax=Sphingomonas TaxID=13687 RepID=UPI000DEFAF37|nr:MULTISPECIES: GIY-YIG nuclease family protein [Sphingomonas]